MVPSIYDGAGVAGRGGCVHWTAAAEVETCKRGALCFTGRKAVRLWHPMACRGSVNPAGPQVPRPAVQPPARLPYLGGDVVLALRGQRGEQVHHGQGVVQVAQRVHEGGVPGEGSVCGCVGSGHRRGEPRCCRDNE